MLDLFSKRKTCSDSRLFFVPSPDPFENPVVETQPRQLRQWATRLTFGNPEQLAESLHASLVRFNRYPAPIKKRHELMAIYTELRNRLQQALQERNSRLGIHLQRQLNLEMAYGYLHLVNRTVYEKPTTRVQRLLLSQIYLAAKYLSLEYRFACQMYDCHGSRSLHELLRLHTLAEERQLHESSVDDPECSRSTIAYHIKLTLLFSLLDPCHLQVAEQQFAFDYLCEFADITQFESLDSPSEPAGRYIIDRLGEQGPQRYDPTAQEKMSHPRFCLFNIIPVSQRLHQDLRRYEKQAGKKPPGPQFVDNKATINLLQRMLKSWHIRLQRESERHATTGGAKLSLGVQAIHHFLTPVESPPEGEAGAGPAIAVALEDDLSNKPQAQYQMLDCWRCNQSRSGVAMLLSLPVPLIPQVGELVMISTPDNLHRADTKLGIIRRALLKDASILEIGIQFINGRHHPVTLQSVETHKDKPSPLIPALYIDLGKVERSYLIVAKGSLLIEAEYRVEEMIPAPSVSAIHLLEMTTLFERFRIKIV
jgi:hypothetical protein